MKTRLFIFGTRHNYQCGGRDCTPEQAQVFTEKIRSYCQLHNIKRMCEEMTDEGRKNYQVDETLGRRLARELNITHRDVDLTVCEKELLALDDTALLAGISETRFKDGGGKFKDAFHKLSDEIRERVFAARVISGNPWPVLLVLGANHAKSFQRISNRLGFEATILHEDYVP